MKRWVFLTGLLLASSGLALAKSKTAVVIVPVADLRSDPSFPTPGVPDDKLQTQLLFGETVEIVKTRGPWIFVNAVDQPEYSTHQKWEGYPGWIPAKAVQILPSVKETPIIVISTWTTTMQPEMATDVWLPLGSLIRPQGKTKDLFVISTALGERCLTMSQTQSTAQTNSLTLRTRVLTVARQFMGIPYLWGGLTPGDSPSQPLIEKHLKFGVDCSGLVHLAYRVNGIVIPRDSFDQWMKAAPVKRHELLPADLIFSAKEAQPKKITHVAFYAGDNQLIEAPQTGMTVRQISFKEKYGKDLSAVESGDRVGDRFIYFGRFVKN